MSVNNDKIKNYLGIFLLKDIHKDYYLLYNLMVLLEME